MSSNDLGWFVQPASAPTEWRLCILGSRRFEVTGPVDIPGCDQKHHPYHPWDDFYGKCRYIYHTWMVWVRFEPSLPENQLYNMSLVGKKVGLEDDPFFLFRGHSFAHFFGWTTHLKIIPQNPCMIYLPTCRKMYNMDPMGICQFIFPGDVSEDLCGDSSAILCVTIDWPSNYLVGNLISVADDEPYIPCCKSLPFQPNTLYSNW